MNIVVVGGGWAGVSAAVAARNAGADVSLLERTDMLLGTGLVGGIMRNNGRFTATEEMIALGGNEIFQTIDRNTRHTNVNFPGHKHASLYDIALIEPAIMRLLKSKGIDIYLKSRVVDLTIDDQEVSSVILDNGQRIEGDVFIDTTGSAGPMGNCGKYGNGCAMCILRCPTFGGRVSLVGKAGVLEKQGRRGDGTIGAMSGSCKLLKESLSKEIVEKLNNDGVAIIPIPEKLRKGEVALASKACQQYALKEFSENVVLLDTGHAKLMSPFFPLDHLREVPGLENARFEDPYSGGQGNSIRYLALSPRDDNMKVMGLKNVFCGGEKAGLLVGHTEAIVTGTLAGHNAVRCALGHKLLALPVQLAVGDAITYVRKAMDTNDGMKKKYTFSGSIYFNHMVERNLYTTDIDVIKNRVEITGLSGIFSRKIK